VAALPRVFSRPYLLSPRPARLEPAPVRQHHLVSDDKIRELSALNGMLYEFLPPKTRNRPKIGCHHVILKADVRDSSRLTRSLMEKGMNALYFSLNFYDRSTSCWRNMEPRRFSSKATPSSWHCSSTRAQTILASPHLRPGVGDCEPAARV